MDFHNEIPWEPSINILQKRIEHEINRILFQPLIKIFLTAPHNNERILTKRGKYGPQAAIIPEPQKLIIKQQLCINNALYVSRKF